MVKSVAPHLACSDCGTASIYIASTIACAGASFAMTTTRRSGRAVNALREPAVGDYDQPRLGLVLASLVARWPLAFPRSSICRSLRFWGFLTGQVSVCAAQRTNMRPCDRPRKTPRASEVPYFERTPRATFPSVRGRDEPSSAATSLRRLRVCLDRAPACETPREFPQPPSDREGRRGP